MTVESAEVFTKQMALMFALSGAGGGGTLMDSRPCVVEVVVVGGEGEGEGEVVFMMVWEAKP